jgi:threonine/homoserine/homoserine lactone efflux protein
MAIAGLAAVGMAVTVAVLLVTGFVASTVPSVLITVLIGLLFCLLWFAFPLTRRHEREPGTRALNARPERAP